MNPIEALVVHRLPGRARLRIGREFRRPDLLQSAKDALLSCPLVREIATNSLTGSILVKHDGRLEDVLAHASVARALLLTSASARRPTPIEAIDDSFQQLDDRLRAKSDGRWGLGAVSFYGLVGASLYQLGQGRVLPPFTTLAFQALTVLTRTLATDRASNKPR